MTYIYLKKAPPKRFSQDPFKKRILAITFFSFGSIFFLSVFVPLVKYQLGYAIKFKQIINPLSPKYYENSGSILGSMSTDYTQLSNWFVDDTSGSQVSGSSFLSSGNDTSYLISIPSLKVKDAVVKVGNMDLKKNLIQYPQTALPGQLGNPVIFGHSVLPQFFNPKSYLTIFSTLYRLKPGDEIYVDFDNVNYIYKVEEMYEVSANDLSVLEQRFDSKYLTLVTCSPPGTVLRRLVVKAKIDTN